MAFINIPKNASQSMDEALLFKLNWTVNDKMDKAKKQNWPFFALIRHPVDRWISGVTQFYGSMGGKMLDKLLSADGMEWFVEKGIHDPHTEPQSWHLKPIPEELRNLFRLEKSENMRNEMGLVTPLPNKHRGRVEIQDRVRAILDAVPRYTDMLLNRYHDDRLLWEQAR